MRDHDGAAGEVDERLLERAQRVDVEIVRRLVEAVQRGIGSGGLDSGVLLPESEQLIARFQALVLEALGN